MRLHLLSLALLPVGFGVLLFADAIGGALVMVLGMIAAGASAPEHADATADATTDDASGRVV